MRKNIERLAQRETGRNLRDGSSRISKLETAEYPYVGLAGDETVAGVKTFTGTIKVGDDALATGKLNVSGDAGGATTTFNRYAASTAAPVFSFQKSRNATIGSHTIVQTNDEFGRLNWQASDGAAFIRGASIIAFSDGTPGTNDMPTRLEISTTADGASTPTQAIRIDSSQNVKIGSGSPAAKLDVLQPTLGSIVQRLQSTATNDDPLEDVVQNRVATTDATVTTLHAYTIPASTKVVLEAHVTASRTGGSGGTAEDGAGYGIVATFKNVAGTATQIGTTTPLYSHESVAGYDCVFDVTGATARVRVTGVASTNITWHLSALRVRLVSS